MGGIAHYGADSLLPIRRSWGSNFADCWWQMVSSVKQKKKVVAVADGRGLLDGRDLPGRIYKRFRESSAATQHAAT